MAKIKSFSIVTYNVQFSINSKIIADNLAKLAKRGVSIFCLQEVTKQKNRPFIVDLILKKLGPNWQEIHNLGNDFGNENMGNCIIWDSSKFNFQKQENFTLRPIKRFALHEWILAKLLGSTTKPYQRRSISAHFFFNDQKFIITNLHLDHIGGVRHRTKQLKEVLNEKKSITTPCHEIICGDFNNFDVLKNGKQTKIMKSIFGNEFKLISDAISWTADLYYMDIANLSWIYKVFNRFIKLHIRRRLDAIWVKGARAATCQKIDMIGSDHFPVLAELYF